MENRKMVPEIRFSGFTDPWEQRKVSEVTKFHKQGFYTTEEYGDDKKYYLLRGTDLAENKLILNDTPKINATDKDYQAFKTEVGDFLIVRSGTVGTYGIVYDDIPAIFGSYLIDFRFDMEQVSNEFFGYFYQSELFKKQLNQIIQRSANTNINAENIKSTSIMFPSLDEQKKISDYLIYIDHLITLHQRKLEKLKTFKKAMLDKMFPKNGELIPEIRFSGFTDPWEQRKFNEIAETRRGLTYNPSDVCEDGIRVLRSSNINEDTFVTSDDDVFVKKDAINIPYACDGDILITSANGSSRLVGKHAIIRQIHNNSAVIGGFMLLATTKNSQFLNASMGSSWYTKFINLSVAGGNGAIGNLSKNELDEKTLFVPSDVEQETIGHFFKNIDKLITLHQRKLEKLQNIKKSMLNKMFI